MISKKVFCDAVKAITDQMAHNKVIEKNLEAIIDGYAFLRTGPALEALVLLLQEITQDKSEWLSYWLFELEQGAKYRPGSVTIDGKIVKMKTVEDLYRVLKAGYNDAKK